MKRTEKHTIRGTMHRHFDLERKITKQAEARLSQSLQRLEAICLYHMKLLTREQRQLQEELQRLQKGQHLSTSALDQDAGSHPNDERTACVDEIRSTDASLQTDKDTGEEIPTSPIGSISAGNIPEETTSSTYLELYAKVKNARYLRHRVPPESERLLSIGEIFGHEKSLLFREGVPT
ncbi:coiled-coil domain-containing protein 190 [Rhynchocyon petersi]